MSAPSYKHYREVEQRDGITTRKYAHMRKNIYSLNDLQKILCNANHRYLEFISSIEDGTAGIKRLKKASWSVETNGHSYKRFNLFHEEDIEILQTIARGEFNINGFQNKNLRKHPSGSVDPLDQRLVLVISAKIIVFRIFIKLLPYLPKFLSVSNKIM